jgi:CheY-like chemotaxis protein
MSHVLDQPISELNSNDPPSIESEISDEYPPKNGKALSKGARILVVDDNHTIADPLAFVLWVEGYTAKAVHSGTEAIAAALEFRPELLISDVVMPDMPGTETAIRVCLMFPDCKVILFSGDALGKELARLVRQNGFEFQFLEKPLHPQKLVSQINLLLPG